MPSACTHLAPSRPPSSSPMAISSSRFSTYLPANGLAITAMASARRVGGLTACPISIRVSSTWTMIFLILTVMLCVLACCRCVDGASAQAVPLADGVGCQPTHPRVDTGAGTHGKNKDNFVRQGGAGNANFNGIEMAAHITGVDMGHGHVQRGARRTHLFGGGHDGQRVAGLAGFSLG